MRDVLSSGVSHIVLFDKERKISPSIVNELRRAGEFYYADELRVECEPCAVGDTCECGFEGECDLGFWIITNKENQPLDRLIIEKTTPSEIQFIPQESGEILLRAICIKPDIKIVRGALKVV